TGIVTKASFHCCGSRVAEYSGGWSAFRTRTAHTLYSGIFEIGSWAAMVSWLALFLPPQWYGTKTVSGRMVFTTEARRVQEPRRLSTVTQPPSRISSRAARRGWISHLGSG